MKSTVETLSPTRVRLAIEVPFAELEPTLKKAYRTIGSQVTVPGFRKGKVPAAVIDQRFGRGAVLNEAIQEAVPTQFLAAVREHEVETLGRPEVEITEFGDGQALRFTAEVDVRPTLILPDLSGFEIPVEPVSVTDEEVDEQVGVLRERFATLKTVERAAVNGDYVQIDLAATVDGEEVPGGSATNISHEVGSGQLVLGLDEALVGMASGQAATFTTKLVAGDLADKDAEVSVTVRTVKEKSMPELDDAFAQIASEFDTLDEVRADLRARLERVARLRQLYSARDKAVEELLAAVDVPAPEGVVREEVEHRKHAMIEHLEERGHTLEAYLANEGRTAEEFETELTEAASHAVRLQLVLDALADQEKISVTEDEFGMEVVHRAQRAGEEPEKYYGRLVNSGAAEALFGELRRGKALSLLLEKVRVVDTDGNPISIAELRNVMGGDAESGEPDED